MRIRLPLVISLFVMASPLACSSQAAAPAAKPAATASEPAPVVDYDQLLLAAQDYINSGKPDRAIDVAKQAVEQKPERPGAYELWGRALMHEEKLAPAAAKYEEARKHGGKNRQLFVELGSIYDVSGKFNHSVEVYRSYLASHPDDAELQHELGLTLLLQEKYPEAVITLKKVCALAPKDPQAHLDYGYALLRNHQLDAAEAQLLPAVTALPHRPEPPLYLGELYAEKGDTTKAFSFLNRAVAVAPKDTRPLRVRARMRLLTGDPKGALDDYNHILALKKDDPAAQIGRAGALIALGRLNDAAKDLDAAHARIGDHPEITFRRAQIAWRRGDAKALAVLQKTAQGAPQDIEAWRELQAAAKKFHRHSLAREAAKQIAALQR